MFCKNCGKQLKEGEMSCSNCGCPRENAGSTASGSARNNITGSRAKSSYVWSTIGMIVSAILRFVMQDEFVTRVDLLENRYWIGISESLKPMVTLAPAVAAIIALLLVSSDQETSGQRKVHVFLINGVLLAISLLLIWLDFPARLFDF